MFRMQDNEFVMCRFYYIAFIEYMLTGLNMLALLDDTNLLSPNAYKKNNNKII